LRLLADEAVQDNREYGVRISRQGYEVRAYDVRDGRWQAQPDWSARQLPQAMQLTLSVEGTPVALADVGADALPPQVVLSSSAQSTPFIATLTSADKHGLAYRIIADGFSEPQVQQVSQQ
ncbi:MAG: GspH/FimT family pseudopilin, partial [Stenotrophomonas sp.]